MKKRLLSILVSLAILSLLWASLDREAIFAALGQTDIAKLSWSLLLLVILIGLSTYRLKLLALHGGFRLSGKSALQATLAANALNMVVPGKLGDLLKAVMMTEDEPDRLAAAVALGFWEKLSDLAFLFLLAGIPLAILGQEPFYAAGLILAGFAGILALVIPSILSAPMRRIRRLQNLASEWTTTLAAMQRNRLPLFALFGLTVVIWSGHLAQITLMTWALGVDCAPSCWVQVIALFPVAIVAGLVPMTFAGVGVRDAALVVLLSSHIGAPQAAALGVLFWLRYLVPGLLGSPLLPRFLDRLRGEIASRRT